MRETHISWVFLTGDYAYKIKKPVRFEFLDFSTLERRRHFCLEELRLNRRYAPDMYLDVVPITDVKSEFCVEGRGAPVEYAVRMRQFDEHELLDHCLREDRLNSAHVDSLGQALAAFHARADPSPPESRFGRLRLVLEAARANFAVLEPRLSATLRDQLDHLSSWTEREAERLADRFEERRAGGHVRECHGDLYLGNMFLHDGRVTFFDGIEFNEDYRWIDVMSELAFTVMDFMDRGRPDFGNRLLNAWLEKCGDYAGLDVLPFYVVYRALVRAKVDALRMGQADEHDTADLLAELQSYLNLADRYRRRSAPQIVITCGVSGSGKTTASQLVVDQGGLVRIRSDVERKRMHGMEPLEPAATFPGDGLYSDTATRDTYNRLAELARNVVQAGYGVIVDATFLHAAQRAQFRQLADSLGTPFQILEFDLAPQQLRRRVAAREQRGGDASDAGLAVLEHQLRTRDPLTDEERPFVDLETMLSAMTRKE